jgi:hypothetical protein
MIRGLIKNEDFVFNICLAGLIIIGLLSLFFLRKLGHNLKFSGTKADVS